jgi:hypothetical protein
MDVAESPEADEALESDEVFDFGTSFFGTMGFGTRWFPLPGSPSGPTRSSRSGRSRRPVGFGDPQYGFESVQEGEWVRGLSITGALLFRW